MFTVSDVNVCVFLTDPHHLRTCKKLMEQATLLSQLQPCHVISYENKLLPLILTYCQYYLQYGKGTEVEYDATAIESDLFGKFIFGKPLILIDEMPIVVLSNDDTFYESIVAKVHQVNTRATTLQLV